MKALFILLVIVVTAITTLTTHATEDAYKKRIHALSIEKQVELLLSEIYYHNDDGIVWRVSYPNETVNLYHPSKLNREQIISQIAFYNEIHDEDGLLTPAANYLMRSGLTDVESK